MNAITLDRGFSFERAGLVLRNRIVEEAPTLGVGLAVVAGINALTFLVSRRFVFNGNGGTLWTAAIILSGILLAAQAFKAMHDGKSGTEWLLLPASPLEKFAAAVVDYLILFPVAAALVSTGLSALFHVLELAVGRQAGPIWTPWNLGILKAWGQYAVGATIFIAGSASFRKGAFLKTAAMAMAYAIALGAIITMGAWIVARAQGNVYANFDFANGHFDMNSSNFPLLAR